MFFFVLICFYMFFSYVLICFCMLCVVCGVYGVYGVCVGGRRRWREEESGGREEEKWRGTQPTQSNRHAYTNIERLINNI